MRFRLFAKKAKSHTNFKFFTELPDEILLQVFLNLNTEELVRLATVSKRFNAIANDQDLWKFLCRQLSFPLSKILSEKKHTEYDYKKLYAHLSKLQKFNFTFWCTQAIEKFNTQQKLNEDKRIAKASCTFTTLGQQQKITNFEKIWNEAKLNDYFNTDPQLIMGPFSKIELRPGLNISLQIKNKYADLKSSEVVFVLSEFNDETSLKETSSTLKTIYNINKKPKIVVVIKLFNESNTKDFREIEAQISRLDKITREFDTPFISLNLDDSAPEQLRSIVTQAITSALADYLQNALNSNNKKPKRCLVM